MTNSVPYEELDNICRTSVVIPVYRGETTLEPLVKEIAPLTHIQKTPEGNLFRVTEVVLVHDGAVDNSREVMQRLASHYPFVSLIWLSRNYGQHAATLAGMASTDSEWVVTMDEDGQYDPCDIGKMLDKAIMSNVFLVYAHPINEPAHGWFRNRFSDLVKWIFVHIFGQQGIGHFNSFRLVQGDIARNLAAYCGSGIYLDVAFSWVVSRAEYCPVSVREDSSRPSGYNYRTLIGHFFRLIFTSSTKLLRLISFLGLLSMLIAILISVYVLWMKVTSQISVPGWAFMIIVICFFSGCTLLSLGIITEYIGALLKMSMGKPLYLKVPGPGQKKGLVKNIE